MRQLQKAGANVAGILPRGLRPAGLYGASVVGLSAWEVRSLRSALHIALSKPGRSTTVRLALSSVTDPGKDAHTSVAYTWAQGW